MLDLRAGVQCAVIANVWSEKKGGGSYQPSDFFPSLKVNQYEKQDDAAALQKQIQANIDAMKMLTWNLQAQGYQHDPDLTTEENAEMAKLLLVEMPAN